MSSTAEPDPTRLSTPSKLPGANSTNATDMTSLSHDVTNTSKNATVLPSTKPDDNSGGAAGGVIALLIGLLVLGIAIFLLFLYLKRSGKLYRMIPFKPLGRSRAPSVSGSERPLDVELEHEQDAGHDDHDDLPKPREGEMFTIDDFDMDTVDIDRQSRGTNDEYFYDEVFGQTQFEDEMTNTSMRQLYLSAGEDDEMLDVDAIVSHITGEKPTKAKT